jgi:glycine/D-amino acid oxidase-like deaminating enzyme
MGGAAGAPAGAPAALITPRGEIRAPVIVLAGEAYLARLRKLHRQLVPLYSLIVLTEPIDDARWAEIGWAGREVVASARLSIDYLSRTADGRILFGGRGAPYRIGSPITDAYDRHDATHEMLRGFVRTWFPMLGDVRFTHAWGGPLGMPRDWHPSFAFDPGSGIASARGYVGHGVSTANLAGRTLADLIAGEQTALTELPLANHRSPSWEVEPFRWLGIRYTQGAMSRLDRRAEDTGHAPTGRSLAERIAGH